MTDDTLAVPQAGRPHPGAEPKAGPELYGIQMLRAVAALAVVAHHALEESNGAAGRFSPDWLTTSGASGVDVFFVISGFIMLHVSFRPGRKPIGPGSFLFRRATRIYPIYWLCCCAMLAASALGIMRGHHPGLGDLVASFLLLPTDNGLLGVAWTLVYEVYFYLLFALALCFGSIWLATAGVTIAIVAAIQAAGAWPGGVGQAFFANPIPLEFCMGLWLAWAFGQWRAVGKTWPVAVAVGVAASALLFVAPLLVGHPDTSGLPGLPRVFAWGVPAALMVAAALRIGPPRNVAAQFAVLLGDASYALYLTHVFVMLVYSKLIGVTALGRADQRFVVPVVVLFAIGIGLAAHFVLERPLLAAIRRATGRQPGHATPA
jgi:exopolysaccharide production protein ExoZ